MASRLSRQLAIAALAVVWPLSAAEAGETEAAAARQVIEAQIKAFKSGQDAAAYSYASPTIQGYFPDVAVFMDMVKRGYAPVYAPRDFGFGRVKEPSSGVVVQEVLVTGPDGKPWTAVYTLVRQPDGAWKINAVQILPGDDSSA